MSDPALTYALCLLSAKDLENPKLSETWAKLNSLAFSEASSQIRKSWGLLANHLSRADADKYAQALSAQEISVKIIPSPSSFAAPAASNVKSLYFSSDALGIRIQNEEALHPWKNLKGLFAFALTETTVLATQVKEGPSAGAKIAQAGIFLATGLPLPIGKKKTEGKTEKRTELMFYLDLLFENPWNRFRIDGQHLDYSILGPKKEMATQSNYRILFDDIRARAPIAYLNKGSRVLSDHKPVATMGYETFQDIDQELVWFLSSQA